MEVNVLYIIPTLFVHFASSKHLLVAMDAVAEAEHVLMLFDAHWFHHQILRKHHHLPPPPARPSPPPLLASPPLAIEVEDAESRTSSTTRPKPPPFHRRSLSDDASHSSLDSPSIRPSPKLQTILSGRVAGGDDEEVASSTGDVEIRIVPGRRDRRRRGRSRRRTRSIGAGASSRSMTDLEFEELKGFMDLGFTFSEAEVDPRLIAIVPGLQRLRAEGSPSASDAGDDQPVRRPYLSEAWDAATAEEEEEEEVGVDPLRNWRIPAAGRGLDMKDHLRFWAHAVASTVR